MVKILNEIGCIDDYRPRDKNTVLVIVILFECLEIKGNRNTRKMKLRLVCTQNGLPFEEALGIFKNKNLNLSQARLLFTIRVSILSEIFFS